MTHLWAGERSELAGLSPATTSADSHPSTQPAPTVSPLAGEQGQVRCQQGVLPGFTAQTLPRTRLLLSPARQELFSGKTAQCD